ncbi:RMD1 family protein [Oscillatoria amoena NRMC-F 0135]|nr:RMD1 family protein [Oscillatoria amoena NRMC-F 0135]
MVQTVKLTALVVANQLDIKGIKNFLDIKPLADSSSELFYGLSGSKYQHYFNYGVIVFTGYTEDEIKYAVKSVEAFYKNPVTSSLRDEHTLQIEPGSDMRFQFDEVVLSTCDERVIRITMFNLAQSVAMDHYHAITEQLLAEVKSFTYHLETTGKLSISRENMLRFIGKALSTQNEVAGNIYVFDAPDLVWDDEYLDKLHQGLIRHFDLRMRFSELEYMLRIIEENLTVFREISNQRESSLLEWIIIILILVEVFDLIISKLL